LNLSELFDLTIKCYIIIIDIMPNLLLYEMFNSMNFFITNHKKSMLTKFKIYSCFALLLSNNHIQGISMQNITQAVCSFLGFYGEDQEIICHSYKAERIINNNKNSIKEYKITYKHFKTKNGSIKTKHIINGSSFTIDDKKYTIRSNFKNTNKIYQTTTTQLGYQQVLVDPLEALYIMNDARYITFADYTLLTPFSSTSHTSLYSYSNVPKSGTLTEGSFFTAEGINYLVQRS